MLRNIGSNVVAFKTGDAEPITKKVGAFHHELTNLLDPNIFREFFRTGTGHRAIALHAPAGSCAGHHGRVR